MDETVHVDDVVEKRLDEYIASWVGEANSNALLNTRGFK